MPPLFAKHPRITRWIDALRLTFSGRSDTLTAALTYYTVLSLAPLLVAAVAIAGVVLGQDSARARLVNVLSDASDPQVAAVADRLMQAAVVDATRWWTVAIGLVVSLWSASKIFLQVQETLNEVWGVRERDTTRWQDGVRMIAGKRAWSFAWVIGIGLLPIASVVSQVAIDPLLALFGGGVLAEVIATAVTTATIAGFLWVIYRYLPDVELRWRETLPGACAAAVVITAGNRALTYYLAHFASTSATAAAGGVLVLLLWVAFDARALLLGAELTRAWVVGRRGRPKPEAHAEWIPEAQETRSVG